MRSARCVGSPPAGAPARISSNPAVRRGTPTLRLRRRPARTRPVHPPNNTGPAVRRASRRAAPLTALAEASPRLVPPRSRMPERAARMQEARMQARAVSPRPVAPSWVVAAARSRTPAQRTEAPAAWAARLAAAEWRGAVVRRPSRSVRSARKTPNARSASARTACVARARAGPRANNARPPASATPCPSMTTPAVPSRVRPTPPVATTCPRLLRTAVPRSACARLRLPARSPRSLRAPRARHRVQSCATRRRTVSLQA